MPMINIEYDDTKIDNSSILVLSNVMQKIVSETTQIDDVFVYANSSQIKVGAAPIEIFVRMSAHKINNQDGLIGEIKSRILDWKTKTDFQHPINLTLIPMNWKIEIAI